MGLFRNRHSKYEMLLTEHLDEVVVATHLLVGPGELIERLGLRDVRIVRPLENELNDEDPKGDLHKFDFDACCALRKMVRAGS